MAKNQKNNSTPKNQKKKDSRQTKESPKPIVGLKDETRHGIFAIVFFVLALFFTMSAFHKAGIAGDFFFSIFSALFGYGYALVPIIFVLLGFSFLKTDRPNMAVTHIVSAVIFLLSSLGIMHIAGGIASGGYIGQAVAYPFIKLFDLVAGVIFLSAIIIISVAIMFDVEPAIIPLFKKVFRVFKRKEKIAEEDEGLADTAPEITEETVETVPPVEEEAPEEPKKETKEQPVGEEEAELPISAPRTSQEDSVYVPPPLSLLEKDKGKPNVGDIKANSNIIKRTLQNFGIQVEMDEITIGPTVTRYALKPAEGVKLAKIVGLQSDLALALAAHPIRIEAPIPGKSLVGVEIPNKAKSMVGLGTLVADDKFQNDPKPLMLALGKNIAGKGIYANLAKMPHALIAGTTGSGKSVTIHTIITSLLYRNGPKDLKFIMIDPKRVELTLYNKIPHLLTPVITDPKKAIMALKWAAKEMERRYDILEGEAVRDIQSYHTNIVAKAKKSSDEPKPDPMPYIVVIIDELADIMTTYPRELEAGIVRLAQMSRAVGIHLLLSTQRPSVNVITGLIKANIPARMALQVSSQIDSRTILDTGGAEKLLGHGDMLWLGGEMSQPERLQCAYIGEEEVKNIVKYLANSHKDDLPDEINLSGSGAVAPDNSIFSSMVNDEEEDDMYEEARMVVIEAGKASTSYIQRKLKVGYSRAARLIDMLEERGVVSAGDGAKPREVLEKSMAAEHQDMTV